MSRTLFRNARLLDPASGLDATGDLLVDGRRIADHGTNLFPDNVPDDVTAIDCRGHLLAPGLIDMRVFTGEPGSEYRETLASASQAAAAGGVTGIVVMPNTQPVIDDVALVDFIKRRARDTASVHVHPTAALTKGTNGEVMTEIGLLKEAGAVAFTDGVRAIANAQVMRRAMSYATFVGTLVVQHAEDADLARDGAMNEGELATRLGLPGIPAAAEVTIIERDLRLLELSGGHYHVAQISSAASLEVVARAKQRGLNVTCGVSAAHLALNENDVGNYRTFLKLSPPLRCEQDRLALIEGVTDGTIDVIVSGHDPQDPETKRRPFTEAAFGGIGLETLLPVVLRLHHNGEAALSALIGAMTHVPARLLGLDCGTLKPGAPADLTLLDLDKPWIVDRAKLRSNAKNTPFEEARLQGYAIATMVDGQFVFGRGDIGKGVPLAHGRTSEFQPVR